MMNPDIQGMEYQRGTLCGWQVRAYVMERDQGRCVYCRRSNARLELDHVRPRSVGSDRVDNLVACCRDCNVAKEQPAIEQFLSDQPALLERILQRLQRFDLAHAAHVNDDLTLPEREWWCHGCGILSQLDTDAAVNLARWLGLRFPVSGCGDR